MDKLFYKNLLSFCIICCFSLTVYSQPCEIGFGAVYGQNDQIERGYSLAATPENDGFFLSGFKNDSVLIARVALSGEVEWARVIDVVPGKPDHAWSIMVDDEGMLGVGGYAGNPNVSNTIFVFKYDPNSHQVLWTTEINPSYRGFTNSLTQKENGGNYLFVSNPHEPGNDDCLMLEFDKVSGSIINSFRKNYNLGGSEAIGDIVMKDGFIYGCGRFTDGFSQANMRHVIIKTRASDGSQVWAKLGHRAKSQTARLYGTDIIIEGDFIYSLYHGDPSGTSVTNTKSYIQKTDLDGNLIWLKQYELPGNNDIVYELVKSGNGFVVLAHQRAAPASLIMFKIDFNGNVIWANLYQFNSIVSPPTADGPATLLIQVGNRLVFTAYSANPTGGTDLILVRTDLDGKPDQPCVQNVPITLTVNDVSNPTFYSINTIITNRNLQVFNHNQVSVPTLLEPRPECFISDTIESFIVTNICEGEQYEGYTETGIYIDSFLSQSGCDSIRTLDLVLNNSDFTNETVEICFNETYQGYSISGFYIDTFQNNFGCDSIRWLNLTILKPEIDLDVTICEGEEFLGYTSAGSYNDILPGSGNSCDTSFHLTLNVLPEIFTSISLTICEGSVYMGYNSTGTYIDTFQTSDGCDSIRLLELYVAGEIITSLTAEICLGDNYQGYTETGFYTDTFQSVWGCDSIWNLDLTVTPIESMIDIQLCSGGQFENYNQAGLYTDTIHSTSGPCDTIRTLFISILPAIESYIQQSLCEGEDYFGHTSSGIYTDTIITQKGCDSIRTVIIDVLPTPHSFINASVCEGLTYGHDKPGIYTDTISSINNCDSILTITLEGVSKYIPNVFSPNNDGVNDIFSIFDYPANSLELEYFAIFDRFGDMAYDTEIWPVVWNGNNLDGQPYQTGVFAYVLIYMCGNKSIIEQGDITIIR